MVSKKVISLKNSHVGVIGDNTHIKNLNINLPKPELLSKYLSKIVSDAGTLIGRDKDLLEIKKKLDTSRTILIVNGLGGIGKTTLARRFIHEYQNNYDHIIWSQVSNGVKNAFLADETLCRNLGVVDVELKEKFSVMIDMLQNLNGNNLMVLDDAQADMVKDDLPKTNNWNILITSRNKFDSIEEYSLDFLSPDNALDLFYAHYKVERNDAIVHEILKPVGYHTLTTELFAKSSDKRKLKLNKLYERIETSGFDLKGKIKVEHSNMKVENVLDYMNAVFPIKDLSDDEINLLRHFALFPAEFIEKDNLEELFDLSRFEDAIEDLAEKGWLEESDTGYKLHQVIQQLILENYSPDLEFYKGYVDVVAGLLSLDQAKDNPIDKFKWRIYGDIVLEHFSIKNSEIAELANNLALRYMELGSYEKAAELLEQALDSSLRNFGEEHPNVARSRSNLALVHKALGSYDKAADLLEQALASAIHNFGEEHLTVAVSQSNLATVYQDLGSYNKAADLLEQALASDLSNFGEEHPDVAVSQSNLASVYQDLGSYEKAVDLLEQALKSYLRNFGEKHPNVAKSQSNLAMVYKDLGSYEKAVDLLEQALASDIRNFGEEHPTVAVRQSNLALVYQDLGYYDKAAELLEQALASDIRNFGEEHPNVARSQSNLASVYQALGSYDKAVDLLEQAFASYLRNFGEKHPTVAVSQSNLALVYKALGSCDKAAELLEQALASDIRNFGEEHPSVAVKQYNLATVYIDLNKKIEAKNLLEKAYNLYVKVLGENHPNTKICKCSLDGENKLLQE